MQNKNDINPLTGRELELQLPTDSAERNSIPLCEGFLDYFPKACAEVARFSLFGNRKHNGEDAPLQWAREKSRDHANKIAKHLLDRGCIDPDSGFLHDVALAWRAMANLEVALERLHGSPMPRGATLPGDYCRDAQEAHKAEQQPVRACFMCSRPVESSCSETACWLHLGTAAHAQHLMSPEYEVPVPFDGDPGTDPEDPGPAG